MYQPHHHHQNAVTYSPPNSSSPGRNPTKMAARPSQDTTWNVRSDMSGRWVFITKQAVTKTTLDVRDLYEGTEYEFRVSAENKRGVSQPSEPSIPVIAKDPWGECSKLFFMKKLTY